MKFAEALGKALDALLPQYKAKIVGDNLKPGEIKTGVRQRLDYLRAPKTGVTDRRLAQLLGVKPDTLREWQKGRPPSKASREKIERVYLSFLRINNRRRVEQMLRGDKLKFHGPDGAVQHMTVKDRDWHTWITQWSRGDDQSLNADWRSKLEDMISPQDWWEEPNEIEFV